MKHHSLHELYQAYRAVWLNTLRLAHRKQSRPCRQDEGTSTPKKSRGKRRGRRKRFVHSRQIRIDNGLMHAIRQFIQQRTSSKDQLIYTSVASFIRDALREYQQGLSMISSTEAERKITTVRLDDELNAFWSTLPRSKRLDILAEILRVKLGGDSSV